MDNETKSVCGSASFEYFGKYFHHKNSSDDTDENNGALKIVPKSHAKGIYRPQTIDWNAETETICNVEKGGIMIMKPLLLHGSNRTTNGRKRRVIHIEFSDMELPAELNWSERMN